MPRSAFNFSLGTLLIAAIGISALLGGILTLNRNTELYKSQQVSTYDQLYDISWQIRAHMDQTQAEFYPASIEDLAAANALDYPERYFTNLRFAELDTGFCTVSGLKRQDGHCIWLFENLPADEGHSGRYVLVIQGEALVPQWMSDETFQDELRDTLKRPGTKVVSNDRKAAPHGWPIPGAKVENNRIEIPTTFRPSGAGPGPVWRDKYYFNIRRNTPAVPVTLFAISTLAALALFIHMRRRQGVT